MKHALTLPYAVLASTASLLSGFYMQGSGHYKLLLFAMAVLGVVGPIMMLVRRAIWALLTSQTWNRGQTPEWVYWLSMCPAGLGYGGA